MYFNVFGERVSRARYREMLNAAKNRQELIAAQFSRRELMKLGLVTSAGLLAPITGLSARAFAQQGIPNLCVPGNQAASPPTTPFIVALPILPIAEPVASLNPAPTIDPNSAAGEGRTRAHQAFHVFPPRKFFNVTQKEIIHSFSPNLPTQRIWGFDDSRGHISSPAPTYVFRYGVPVLVRNHNALPPEGDNGGFGKPSVSTHLHNHHTPSESDGFPGDFFERGQFYDQHYPNQLAGVLSTHRSTGGDINEALSSLWFHDHRLNFTSQNTYKGLLGLCCIFNEFDTGNEHTGFRLPSFPEFDIPMAFADKVFGENGKLFFDLFNLDGILGDKFLINGQIQPFFKVQPRRYRFRWVDTGPSRFYEFFLTDPKNLDATNQFWVIANDGNLLPKPVKVTSARIGVAERVDVIIDFRPFAGKSIFLENRLNQLNGQGPVIGQECGVPEINAAGHGNLLMRFDVDSHFVDDDSAQPEQMTFYSLPKIEEPRITRTLKFDRLNGQWSVNGQFVGDLKSPRFRVGINTTENWILSNVTGNWTHPVHIHFEEHQILARNQVPPSLAIEHSRKDVTQLRPNSRVQLFFRFRDFHGRYPMHCHNLIHEDHGMMLRWDIDPDGGDAVLVP